MPGISWQVRKWQQQQEGQAVRSSGPYSHIAPVLKSSETPLVVYELGEPQTSDSLQRTTLFPQKGVNTFLDALLDWKLPLTVGDHTSLLVTYTPSLGSSPSSSPTSTFLQNWLILSISQIIFYWCEGGGWSCLHAFSEGFLKGSVSNQRSDRGSWEQEGRPELAAFQIMWGWRWGERSATGMMQTDEAYNLECVDRSDNC